MLKMSVWAISSVLLCSVASAETANWTGWHAMGSLGVAQGGDAQVQVALADDWNASTAALRSFVTSKWALTPKPTGGVLALQGGYDFQYSSGWVVGAELEFAASGADDSRQTGQIGQTATSTPTYDFGAAAKVKSQLTASAKLGYAFDRALGYLMVGYTSVDATLYSSVVSSAGYSKLGRRSDSLGGMRWGVGYAFRLKDQWSIRSEILRTDTGKHGYTTGYASGSTLAPPANTYTETIRQNLVINTWRVGVDYRF